MLYLSLNPTGILTHCESYPREHKDLNQNAKIVMKGNIVENINIHMLAILSLAQNS